MLKSDFKALETILQKKSSKMLKLSKSQIIPKVVKVLIYLEVFFMKCPNKLSYRCLRVSINEHKF